MISSSPQHPLTSSDGEVSGPEKQPTTGLRRLQVLESFVPSMVMESMASSIIRNSEASGGNQQPLPLLPEQPFVETSSDYCAVALADISGFTPLTERLTASSSSSAGIEELSKTLNSYFGQMIEIVQSHGGDVIKFAGDALLIAFRKSSNEEEGSVNNCCIPRDENCLSPTSQQRSSWKNKVQEFQTSALSPTSFSNQAESESTTPSLVSMAETYRASWFATVPMLKDEVTDVCMRCEEGFTGLGNDHRSYCASCGAIACDQCTSLIYDKIQANLVSVCDYCVSSSPLISYGSYLISDIQGWEDSDWVSHIKSNDNQRADENALNCVRCCLEMQEKLDNVHGLRLHIGIGVGTVSFMNVGGVMDRWEFLMAGNALSQMSIAEANAKSGEVCVSPKTWSIIASSSTAESVRKEDGVVRVIDVRVTKEPKKVQPISETLNSLNYSAENYLQLLCDGAERYIPGCIRSYLEHTGTSSTSLVGSLGEIRKASVLFVNLPSIDYTAQSTAIVEVLQETMRILQEKTYAYEGSIRQFIMDDKGTTMIIVFGLYPFAHDNDPVLATQCAMAIVAELKLQGMACKIGVTTGTVFAGPVGSVSRCEYAVIGDIVNLSARLMVASLNMSNIDVLCDSATVSKASHRGVEFVQLNAPLTVKGKKKPLVVSYPVMPGQRGLSASLMTPVNRVSSPRTTMIKGGSGVLTKLKEIYHAMDNGKGRVVYLEADVGMGKTRNLKEFVYGLSRRHENEMPKDRFEFLSAASYKKHVPFSTIQPVMNEVTAKLVHMFPTELFSSKWLCESIVSFVKQDSNSILDHKCWFKVLKSIPSGIVSHLLAQLHKSHPTIDFEVPAAIEDSIQDPLSILQQFSVLFLLLKIEMVRRAGSLPFVLVIDSAQWVDQVSWAGIQHIARKIYSCSWKILAIVSARPLENYSSASYEKAVFQRERSMLLGIGRAVSSLKLKALSAEQTNEMIEKIVNSSVDRDVLQHIYKRTNGNPLYVEEMLRALLSKGVIEKEKRRSEDGNLVPVLSMNTKLLHESSLPDSLQGIMCSRIDSFSPRTKWMLKVAAVVGNSGFNSEILCHLLTCNETESGEDGAKKSEGTSALLDHIDEELLLLQNAGILDVEFKQDCCYYAFRNPMIQETAYSMILYTQRNSLHSKAANYLQETQLMSSDHRLKTAEWYTKRNELSRSGGLSHLYATIGFHRTNAREFEAGIEMYNKAANIAQRNFSHEEMAQHIRSAVSIDHEVREIIINIVGAEAADAKVFINLKSSDKCGNNNEDGKTNETSLETYLRALHWLRLTGNAYREVSRWGLAIFYYRVCLCIAFETSCKGEFMEVSKFKLKDAIRKFKPSIGSNSAPQGPVFGRISFDLADSILATKLSSFRNKTSTLTQLLRKVDQHNAERKSSLEPSRWKLPRTRSKSSNMSCLKSKLVSEIAEMMCELSQLSYLNDDNELSTFSILESIRYGILASTPSASVLAQAFSFLAIHNHQIATSVVENSQALLSRCKKLSRYYSNLSGSPSAIATTNMNLSLSETYYGRWIKASECALTAIETFESLRDVVGLENSRLAYATCLSFQGKLTESEAQLKEAQVSSVARRDISAQIRSLIARAVLVDKPKSIESFTEAIKQCQELEKQMECPLPPADAVRLQACSIHAFDKSELYYIVTDRLMQMATMPFDLFPCFTMLGEAALKINSGGECGAVDSVSSTNLRNSFSDLLLKFKKFSRLYPIARSEYKRLRGLYKWHFSSNEEQAQKKWVESIQAASDMPVYRGLTHLELYSHTKSLGGDVDNIMIDSDDDYTLAKQAFKDSGATYLLLGMSE